MRRRGGGVALAVVALAVAALAVAPPAAAQTSTVTDPVGDVRFNAPAFQDITMVSIAKASGTFTFVMDLAGAIPASLPLPPPAQTQIWWAWGLDTNPATFPRGFPFAPGVPSELFEFVVLVSWDGTRFAGILIDRTPLPSGGAAVTTPIPFSIQGAEVALSVRAGMIGDPSTFMWGGATLDWSAPLGTQAIHIVDTAPNFPLLAPWPS